MRRAVLYVVLLTAVESIAWASSVPLLRISVENTANHVQTRTVQRFADLLGERLDGMLEVQFHPAARLYRDADVFKAITQGKLEMAVPGTWQFDRYVPEIGVLQLPSLFGMDAQAIYRLVEDSPIGADLKESIRKNLGLVVLGRWIDLGYTHIFSGLSAIRSQDDFQGKRIRVAGGVANTLRISALGGLPVTIAWPDLPNALRRNAVDALLTSYETLASASLWGSGIRYAYEDRQYFAQYIPVVSASFWSALDDQTRFVMIETWDGVVDQARTEAAIAQERAKMQALANGVEVVVPSEEELAQSRRRLMQYEDSMAMQIGIPSGMLESVHTYAHSQNLSNGGVVR